MTQDEIIEITRQAGGFDATPEFLAKFAKLVAQHEREACAKVCESRITPGTGSVAILNGAAGAIRARGQA
jgi:hypothetical protein